MDALMANPSKDKGTAAETTVLRYLRSRGLTTARREVQHGNRDHGDIHVGQPGRLTALEIKWRPKLPSPKQVAAWMVETDTEAVQAGADLSALVYNRPGYGAANAGHWLVVMRRDEFMWLASRGGYEQAPTNEVVTIDLDQFAGLLAAMPGRER
jgi:hypothetical protein